MNSLEILKALEKKKKKKKLTFLEKLLAVTTGSVTQILEAYLGEPVRIRTLKQEVKPAGPTAEKLGINKTDLVNFREVEITDRLGKVLVMAESQTPLNRLEPGFKDDLMKADMPIGKLLLKHKIESRRELLGARIVDGKIERSYIIIKNEKILMHIEERIEV